MKSSPTCPTQTVRDFERLYTALCGFKVPLAANGLSRSIHVNSFNSNFAENSQYRRYGNIYPAGHRCRPSPRRHARRRRPGCRARRTGTPCLGREKIAKNSRKNDFVLSWLRFGALASHRLLAKNAQHGGPCAMIVQLLRNPAGSLLEVLGAGQNVRFYQLAALWRDPRHLCRLFRTP